MQQLAAAVDGLVDTLPGDTPGELLMGVVTDLEAQIRRLQGLQLACLEKVDRCGAAAATHTTTAAWLRTVLRLGGHDAHRRVHLARDLADALPQLGEALRAGQVSVAHAQQAARLRQVADDEQRKAEVDPVITDAARTMDPTELRSRVTATMHSLAPDHLAAGETRLFGQRELHLASTFGGAGVGHWLLDPVGQEKVLTAFHAASAPIPGDDRSPRQRRADGLVNVCEFYTKHATRLTGPDTPLGGAAQITVIVGWETLAGRPGAPSATTGHGQISGAAARRLACDATMGRIITGPGSEILDAGRASRSFTRAARRAITARDRHCIWPGCHAPAAWCDAHHIVHWAHGGASDVDNGALLCGRHHDRVHHDRRAIRIRHDGTRTVDLYAHRDDWPVIDERKARGSPYRSGSRGDRGVGCDSGGGSAANVPP